jgi:hypothetical protein
MDDIREVEQIFNSQPESVGTKGTPTSRWWECVWSDTRMKKGRLTNWSKTYRNRNEWKKATEQFKVHLGLQSQLRRDDIGRIEILRKPKKRWLVMLCDLARFSGAQQH